MGQNFYLCVNSQIKRIKFLHFHLSILANASFQKCSLSSKPNSWFESNSQLKKTFNHLNNNPQHLVVDVFWQHQLQKHKNHEWNDFLAYLDAFQDLATFLHHLRDEHTSHNNGLPTGLPPPKARTSNQRKETIEKDIQLLRRTLTLMDECLSSTFGHLAICPQFVMPKHIDALYFIHPFIHPSLLHPCICICSFNDYHQHCCHNFIQWWLH